MTRTSEIISLSEHCEFLSRLLSELPLPQPKSKRDYQILSWSHAGDWLHIAASLKMINIDTTRFDASVQWCRSAWEFESKRSELLGKFISSLSVFIFIWGGLETVIKIIAPSGFDYKEAKQIGRKGDMIDRAIFFLKNEYATRNCVPLYEDILTNLRLIIKKHTEFSELSNLFKEDKITGFSGLGIHIVSMIRNSFAHGSAHLPFPENWGEQELKLSETELMNLELIETSSHVILLTIQMLIQAYFKNQHFKVNILKDNLNGFTYSEDIHVVLRVLHLDEYKVDQNQLNLFSDGLSNP